MDICVLLSQLQTLKNRFYMRHSLFRPLLLLVLLSMGGIFIYQAYWLTGLYHTMNASLEQSILEAMRQSDYDEMMVRIRRLQESNKAHGEIKVEAGYDASKDEVCSTTVVSRTGVAHGSPDAMLSIRGGGMGITLQEMNTLQELARYLQGGIHSGLDVLMEPDVAVYDSLLVRELERIGLSGLYRLDYLHRLSTGLDTVSTAGSAGYEPTPKAKRYEYAYDVNSHHLYRLTMEPVESLVLHQMTGILATSLVILLLLAFSFWFLIRTIMRQKTLEEMKSDFTNNITHELKTPIAVAYAANDALLNFGQAEEKARRDQYLRICQEQLQRLGGLVEQILSISMERRKTFELHREEFAVRSVLEPLVEQHQLKADKPVRISLSIQPDELTVRADRTHFGHILSNLIDNAIKYSREEAEVEIVCHPFSSSEGAEGHVEITVTDRGIGIAPDKQKHVFDKFYRVPTGNLHDVKGYGLGLFYVKTMVEKHGGRVEVRSEWGKGSRFRVII